MSEVKRVGISNVLPPELRGVIKGQVKPRIARIGGDVTNAKYAQEKGITKRQASKQRRGY